MNSQTLSPPSKTIQSVRPAVVLLVDDLFFSARLADAVSHTSGIPIVVSSPEAFLEAMDTKLPVLAVVDLHLPGDWERAVSRCKLRPHTKSVPIIGFGQHTDVETLTRAKKAGTDKAWARSRLVEELPKLLQQHISPPRPMPEGGTDALPPAALVGIDLFNKGRFHDQHEAFEEAWIAEPRNVRSLYQGILQIGLAFLQIENRNQPGAFKMFGRGIPRLRVLPDVVQGVQVVQLLSESLAIFERLSHTDSPSAWDELKRELPRIWVVEQT